MEERSLEMEVYEGVSHLQQMKKFLPEDMFLDVARELFQRASKVNNFVLRYFAESEENSLLEEITPLAEANKNLTLWNVLRKKHDPVKFINDGIRFSIASANILFSGEGNIDLTRPIVGPWQWMKNRLRRKTPVVFNVLLAVAWAVLSSLIAGWLWGIPALVFVFCLLEFWGYSNYLYLRRLISKRLLERAEFLSELLERVRDEILSAQEKDSLDLPASFDPGAAYFF